MGALDWRFPAILVAAMLLGLLLTYAQMRSYNSELNKATRVARGEHLMLVSGRGRSITGGAIVIAIVDTTTRSIIWARTLAGKSVFARFHDAPGLLGDMDGAVGRARGKQLKAAVDMALAQVGPAPGAEAPPAEQPATTNTNNAPAPTTGPRLVRKRVPHTTGRGAVSTRGV